MNDDNKTYSCNEDYISLFDIWQKLVLYKKTYWIIFSIVFVLGATTVLLKPKKYEFTQAFDVGRYMNSDGSKTLIDEDLRIDSRSGSYLTNKIKMLYLPSVVRKYNLGAKEKISQNSYRVNVEDVGGGTFILSATATRESASIYQDIYQGIIDAIYEDTYTDIKFRIKNLKNLKKGLEGRVLELNSFHKAMMKSGYGVTNIKAGVSVENKVIAMYLNDQLAATTNLIGNINTIQMQIDGTYNTKAVTDFIVSDTTVSPSKFLLLILLVLASFFSGFFGVFIVDFITNLVKQPIVNKK